MVDAIDGQLKVCVVGSHRPTQSALRGANTTTPLPAVAAPANFKFPLMVDAIDGQLLSVAGSHNPTQWPTAQTRRRRCQRWPRR